MFSPPREDEAEKADSRHKKKFMFACDDMSDEEEAVGMRALLRATQEDHEEIDVVEQTLHDTLEESRADTCQRPGDTHGLQQHQNEEPNELFVSPEEEGVPATTTDSDNVEVKSEPDDDDCCMVIDPTEASSGAQEKWAKPQKFTIDLTFDTPINNSVGIPVEVKKEVKSETTSNHSPTEAGCIKDIPEAGERQLQIEGMEKRMCDLQAKALRGALSPTELAELLQLPTKLNDAKGSSAKTSSKNSKKGGSGRKKNTKEDYWAKMAERQRKQKHMLAEKRRKRNAKGTSKAPKRCKTSRTSETREDSRDTDDEEFGQDPGVARQIDEMLRPLNAILERASQGELPAELNIKATKKEQQLKKMREAAPEYFEKDILEKQERELRESTHAWGPYVVRAKNGKWEIRRVLMTPLHNHQIIVGAWMMGRELMKTSGLPLGGILADAMGLGKTIETLSCISGNPSPERLKEKGEGATLVVCPSEQMIGVWISEIKKHCGKRFARDMVRYKKQNKMDIGLLGSFNIVLATYHQVRASTPSIKEREEKQREIVDVDEYKEWLEQATGDLHRIKWYRVVLDEAHSIKNHSTHGAFACFQLKSEYRWVVSGTPLTNSDTEFFSYFKFLGCRGMDRFKDYNREFHDGEKARDKHHRLISQIMYRRTQNDWFLGQPILNLPPTIPTHQHLQLSREEMVVFRMMERCFRRKVNDDLQQAQDDTIADRQLRSYLTILLRLRQAATHPFLLESMMNEYFNIHDLRITKARLATLKGKQTVYEQIGSWNERHEMKSERMKEVIAESERISKEEARFTSYGTFEDHSGTDSDNDHEPTTPIPANTEGFKRKAIVIDDYKDEVDSQDDVELDEDGMVPEEYLGDKHVKPSPEPIRREIPPLVPFGRSDFGLRFDMDKQLEYLMRLEDLKEAPCAICDKKPPQTPLRGQCGCIFCTHCLMDHTTTRGRYCPHCRHVIGKPKPLEPFHSGDSDEELDFASNASPRQKRKNDKDYSHGFDHNGFQHQEEDKKDKQPIRFLQISDKKTDIPVTPSAKMTALKETILRWQHEAPDDKIIVFSQFTIVMKIVGRMLEAENIPFAYLSGKHTTEQREKAVADFQEGDVVKVLIVSLRAGGQCLNLTRGNRVILMELWWNHAVEQQAFSRVFRIGQIKETHFVRFIVNTPIEKRMLKMQIGKILRIDAALQDEGVRTPKVGLEDIANLLGKVVRRKGVMQVVADYSDGEDDDDDPDMPGSGAARRAAEEEEDLPDFVVNDDEIEYEGDDDLDVGLSNHEDSDDSDIEIIE
ncbi:SNF2 family domain-containing protein [Colletotrichum karsti]|uniref:SNF2 family domain-containing protein n=1 Tax=Colletotrichum karsti TaxID=1095194 RepID=A0A9P6HYB8_9PEZI|nr:SNF2 family domain-containing protein [Colletotrichum karsti]KAF9872347.1 SNF2 family domain-containing protein [Colletotrichum karsti]